MSSLKKRCFVVGKFLIDFTNFQDVEDKTYTSTSDRFFGVRTFQRVYYQLMSCTYLKLHQTTVPCFVKTDVNKLPATFGTPKAAIPHSPKSCWRMANEIERNNYITLHVERLRSLEVPDGVDCCRDVNCVSEYHIEEIDECLMCILSTIR